MKNDSAEQLTPELISFGTGYLLSKHLAISEATWHLLPGDGSDRTFYRLSHGEGSVVVVVNEYPRSNEAGINENDSFLYIGEHLRSKGIGTPEIYQFQRERGWFIVEDLGNVHLQDEALKIKDDHLRLKELYQKVLTILPLIQVKGAQGFDVKRIHSAPYDQHFVRIWESGYFFRCFLKEYLHLDLSEEFLDDEFNELARILSSVEDRFFLYRDFQSRNIMIKENQIRFVDFQGGRGGPLHYDLASLLLDPYVDLEEQLRTTLLEYYLDRLQALIPIDREQFLAVYPVIALHRAMQILGAFAYLSTVKKRPYFAKYIPAAIKNLQSLCALAIFSPYKNLRKVVDRL